MSNKEQIKKDLVLAFDFIEQVISTPDILDKIPNGSSIIFLDEENTKTEKHKSNLSQKKYVRVKRQFEVL